MDSGITISDWSATSVTIGMLGVTLPEGMVWTEGALEYFTQERINEIERRILAIEAILSPHRDSDTHRQAET